MEELKPVKCFVSVTPDSVRDAATRRPASASSDPGTYRLPCTVAGASCDNWLLRPQHSTWMKPQSGQHIWWFSGRRRSD